MIKHLKLKIDSLNYRDRSRPVLFLFVNYLHIPISFFLSFFIFVSLRHAFTYLLLISSSFIHVFEPAERDSRRAPTEVKQHAYRLRSMLCCAKVLTLHRKSTCKSYMLWSLDVGYILVYVYLRGACAPNPATEPDTHTVKEGRDRTRLVLRLAGLRENARDNL